MCKQEYKRSYFYRLITLFLIVLCRMPFLYNTSDFFYSNGVEQSISPSIEVYDCSANFFGFSPKILVNLERVEKNFLKVVVLIINSFLFHMYEQKKRTIINDVRYESLALYISIKLVWAIKLILYRYTPDSYLATHTKVFL